MCTPDASNTTPANPRMARHGHTRTVHTMARARTLFIAGLLGAGAAGTLAGALTVQGAAPDTTDLPQALIACTLTGPDTIARESETCMENVLTTGVATIGIAQTHLAVAAAEARNPNVSGSCHTVAHRVGRQAFHDGEDLYQALPILTTHACQSGLMHGMHEGWADTDPDDTEVQRLVQACEQLAQTPQTRDIPGVDGMCGEAIGHASWLGRHNADYCRFFTVNAAREQCGVGVVMQMYLPAGADTPNPGVTLDDVVQLCRTWPAELQISDCQAGAAWPVVQNYRNAMSDTVRELGGQEISPAATEELLDELDTALSWCHQVDQLDGKDTGAAHRPCARYLIGYVTEHADAIDHLDQHCQRFGTDMASYCQDFVNTVQPTGRAST